MLTNIRNTRIEWNDCDPQGVVYYPRYFEMFDTCANILIERALGMSKLDYLKAYNIFGHPAVETRARFRASTRFGDQVAIETALVACGRTSFRIEHRLTKAGALAVEAFETRVWAIRDPDDPARLKPQPIPAAVVARLMPGKA